MNLWRGMGRFFLTLILYNSIQGGREAGVQEKQDALSLFKYCLLKHTAFPFGSGIGTQS